MRLNRRRSDSGFTLLELVVAIVIMGIITVPLGNFLLAYLRNYKQTETRIADSHDIQIATAYFSQDIANSGLRVSPTQTAQFVWTNSTGFPSSYCGKGTGTPLLVLMADDWTYNSTNQTGTNIPDSVTYAVVSGSLHRLYCYGRATNPTIPSDTLLVHGFYYSSSGNPDPITCSTACDGSTSPPNVVNFKLSIQGPTDSSVSYTTLTGRRRQT